MRLLVLALLGVVGMAKASGTDYTDYGPFDVAKKIFGFTMPKSTGCNGWDCNIKITVTRPQGEAAEDDLMKRHPPFPTVFFFSAFQSYADYYKEYAEHLASWGYVVVQYDTKKLCLITDKVELEYFPVLVGWLYGMNEAEEGFLYKSVDFERIGVAGHSRGGKLAALHAIRDPMVRAAYLIDPVDSDGHYAKESEDYPSAVTALSSKAKMIGVVGSGITGRCNPEGTNFKQFFEALGVGSWLTVIEEAGHCQYMTAPKLFEWSMGLLCGHGGDSCEEVITVTRPGLVAWFEKSLHENTQKSNEKKEDKVGSFLDAFFDWVSNMEKKAVLKFQIKGDSSTDFTTKLNVGEAKTSIPIT